MRRRLNITISRHERLNVYSIYINSNLTILLLITIVLLIIIIIIVKIMKNNNGPLRGFITT